MNSPTGALTPTPEQRQIIEAFSTGQSVRVAAGAGTGKTTVLRMAAETAPTRRGLYVAFNKAIATDAQRVFGRNVKVATTHSLAFRALGHRYKDRLNGPRVPAQKIAQRLGIRGAISLDGKPAIQPAQQARYVQDMVRQFCASASEEITSQHLPPLPGIEPDERQHVAQTLLPWARRLWEDKTTPEGTLPFIHDDYLKQWALTHPDWGAEFILYDEAQDSTPVVAGMVKDQQAGGAQIVVVGDSAQSIYAWRGAVDAMDTFDAPCRCALTQSWRFGQAVADEANKWLSLLDAELRLTGNPHTDSRVDDSLDTRRADAVLCRTNATAISEIVAAQRAGVSTAIVGGGNDARRLADAADRLQAGQPTWHPELALFPTWGAVQDYAEEPSGQDLRPFVRLIDDLGPAAVMAAIDRCVADESRADVVVSTAHKAKGREWGTVTIADDFTEPDEDEGEDVDDEEAMLAYVSVTRAQKVLHRGGLAWVDRWVPRASASRPETAPAARPASSGTAPSPGPSVAEPVAVTEEPLTVTLSPETSAALRSRVGAAATHEALAAAADTFLRGALRARAE